MSEPESIEERMARQRAEREADRKRRESESVQDLFKTKGKKALAGAENWQARGANEAKERQEAEAERQRTQAAAEAARAAAQDAEEAAQAFMLQMDEQSARLEQDDEDGPAPSAPSTSRQASGKRAPMSAAEMAIIAENFTKAALAKAEAEEASKAEAAAAEEANRVAAEAEAEAAAVAARGESVVWLSLEPIRGEEFQPYRAPLAARIEEGYREFLRMNETEHRDHYVDFSAAELAACGYPEFLVGILTGHDKNLTIVFQRFRDDEFPDLECAALPPPKNAPSPRTKSVLS